MTNNGIKTSTILDALYKEKAEEWRNAEPASRGHARLSYSDFSKILRKNEIVIDPRTIKLKWDLLTDIGIFAASNKYSAVVDLVEFENRAPMKYSLLPYTYTYTQKPEGTQEASE